MAKKFAPRESRLKMAICLGVFSLFLTGCANSQSSTVLPPSLTPTPITADGSSRPLVIFSAGTQSSKIVALIRASGYVGYVGGISELQSAKSLLVSNSSILSTAELSAIKNWTQAGGKLVSFNRQLNATFGLLSNSPEAIQSTNVPYLARPTVLANNTTLAVFHLSDGFESLATANELNGAKGNILLTGSIHKGALLASSFDPFAANRLGYEIVPSLGRVIGKFATPAQGPSSVMNIAYLDPGTLPASLKFNFSQIAQDLSGYRAVEVAAWDSAFVNPANNYPYESLINALHARGILAFAWIEPPFVNLYMWQTYPQCRELTATGSYAIDDWRQVIALEDPSCFAIALQQWRPVLTQYAWDGVNVAELYFQPPNPPAQFTPFSKSALALFGANPMANISSFLRFREDLVATLDGKILSFVKSLPNGGNLDLQLTVIDDSLDKTEALDLGSNLNLLSKVAHQAGATLQVEDPYTTWTKSPERYFTVAAHANALMSRSEFTVDINDVNRGSSASPTAQPTMGELDLQALAAGSINGKVAFYEFGTLSQYDFSRTQLSVGGSTVDYPNGLKSNFTVSLQVEPLYGRLILDGNPWPVGRGTAVIPSGEHNLAWEIGNPVSPGILWIDASLGTAEVISSTSIGFTYFSKSNAYVKLSSAPTTAVVNGQPLAIDPVADTSGGYWVRLPPGTNSVVMKF